MRTMQTRRSERGAVSLMAALSLVVLAGVAALAVDLGHLRAKRADLQNAADAAALAGASASLSWRGDPAAVRRVALEYALKNLSPADRPETAVTAADVDLLLDGLPDEAAANQVEVRIARTAERGNPVELFFGRVLGRPFADLTATARAGLFPVCTSKCVKPFIVPTKFTWDDTAAGAGSAAYNNGELDVNNPAELGSVQVIGYSQADVGARVTLKYGDPHDTVAPGQYSAVDLPPVNKGDPVTGAAEYKENIAGCTGSNTVLVELDDELCLEPGNMVGPTDQGLRQLLAQDPYAAWDDASGSITGSDFPDPLNSPRVGIVAFYDPRYPPTSGRNTLRVYQLGAVFIENVQGQGVITARFINTLARSPQSAEGECLTFIARLIADSSREG
ncbi:MAG: pilus assembly protein TadG-related protein [Thermodesulfobacteriota bacterium]